MARHLKQGGLDSVPVWARDLIVSGLVVILPWVAETVIPTLQGHYPEQAAAWAIALHLARVASRRLTTEYGRGSDKVDSEGLARQIP